MNSERLSQLAAQAEDIARRAERLGLEMGQAEAVFVEGIRAGSDPAHTEVARLNCVSIYEMKLDLIVEAGANQRALAEETGIVPK